MLVLSTVAWGVSFPLMKEWMQAANAHDFPGGDSLAAVTLIGLRMVVAVALIGIFMPRLVRGVSGREFVVGFLLGLFNSFANVLQVWGIGDTSPALSAFFTSLASPIVPLLGYVLYRTAVARLTLVGLALGMGGVLVLSMRDRGQVSLHAGDVMTIVSALIFAVFILALGRWGATARPGHLLVGLLAGTGLPALLIAGIRGCTIARSADWLPTLGTMLAEPHVLLVLGVLILVPTVLASYWMSTYQPHVPASRAALIYLLEPVFATTFSVAWRLDVLSIHLVAGGILIVGGNLLAELPGLMRMRKKNGIVDKQYRSLNTISMISPPVATEEPGR